MTGRTLIPTTTDVILSIGSGVRQQVSASVLNSYRMAAVSERLTSFVKSGQARDPVEFYNLLLSLSRGIDYAVANNEVPNNVLELPLLLKQICRRHSDPVSRGVILVLLMSVKNACKQGWFQAKEAEELLFLENEIGSTFRSMNDTCIGSSICHPIIKTVIERFYPRMKIGEILASLDAKPGFRGYNLDFHISKNSMHSPDEKICLFVAQVDSLETSSCIISPQQVDFLLNGKHVDRRTNVFMVAGPQMPTNVTPLLKYGTNLLQAVGRFNGPYIIVIAFMSLMPSLEAPVLQDYVQPVVVASDSDPDIIEGPSRISLNCPISYQRIRTPVKGHSCKHLQCFDLRNFLTINLRRPSWRCPHCNQSVCYLDIRIDQNMVKVLKEVGEDVADVTISSDGSWKAVLEDNKNSNQAHEKALDSIEGSPEQQGNTNLSTAIPNIVDLTEDKNEMEMDCTCEIEDRKPFQDSLRSTESNLSGGNNVQHSFITNLEDEFLRRIHSENGMTTSVARSDNQLVGGVSWPRAAILQPSPLSTGDISLELSRETENQMNVCPPASEMANQVSSPNNLHSEQLQIVNSNASNEYGRFPTISRMMSRTPVAVQALPAQAQAAVSRHRLRTNLNSLSSSVPSITSQVGPSPSNGHNFVNTDVELRQHIPRSCMGPQTSDSRPTAQNRHHIPPYRMSSGLGGFQNQHLQLALNPRMSPPISPNTMRLSSPFSRSPVQLGSAQAGTSQISGTGNSQLTSPRTSTLSGQSPTLPISRSRIGSTLPPNPDAYKTSAVDQRGVMGGTRAVPGADGLSDLLPEQEPRPAGRMRGSVTDQVYSAALNQLHMQQNHRTHPVRPPSNLSTPTPIVPSHLQMLIANRNAQASQRQNTNNSPR